MPDFTFQLRRRLCSLIVGALLPLAAAGVAAQPYVVAEPPTDVLTLGASGSVEVVPDQLTIVLQALREGPEAAAVQSQLKTVLDQALVEARTQVAPGALNVRTGQFTLQPRHARDGRIQSWTGRAELILEGTDVDKVSRLAGRLSQLTVASVGFGLSPELLRRTEAQAQQQAVEQFKARAQDLARAFGFAGYGLREVNVQSADGGIGQPRLRMAAMAVAAEQAPVPVEAGRVNVTVMVNGSVQMRR